MILSPLLLFFTGVPCYRGGGGGGGATALVVGVGGGCLDIFTLIYPFLSSFSLSLGDGPI